MKSIESPKNNSANNLFSLSREGVLKTCREKIIKTIDFKHCIWCKGGETLATLLNGLLANVFTTVDIIS